MVYNIQQNVRRFIRQKRSFEHADPPGVVGSSISHARNPQRGRPNRGPAGNPPAARSEDRLPAAPGSPPRGHPDPRKPRHVRGTGRQQHPEALRKDPHRKTDRGGSADPRPGGDDDVVPRAPSAMTADPFEGRPFFFVYEKDPRQLRRGL